MKRIKSFGSLSTEQQLDMLNCYLGKKDVLLFQEYNFEERREYDECMDFDFQVYCYDAVYYYNNPALKVQIEQEVLDILVKDAYFEKFTKIRRNKVAKELFEKIKQDVREDVKYGAMEKISKKTLNDIKIIVFNRLANRNENFHKFVFERSYGTSKWILDERGKVQDTTGSTWYRLLNRDEYLEAIKRFQLFSCIIVEEGATVDEFSLGFVVDETADDYDLLVFKND